MPMAELADAVVQCGRTTLEWTMKVIQDGRAANEAEGTGGWSGARVVYGDTDSVFVHLPGRSRAEAFRIGDEIARHINAASPAGVLLKLEKVYIGCVLCTKKRYVGRAYESAAQQDDQGHFDAKGLECIRRDQCPATAKIQEGALRVLFATNGDLSAVKAFLHGEWRRVEGGINAVSAADFTFHRAVKLGHYSSPASYPPGATVALKRMLADPRGYPVYKWRVPYLVVYGASQRVSLRDLVVAPEELLLANRSGAAGGASLALNARYYVLKCINPALARSIGLCGADVAAWYRELAPHAVVQQRRAMVQRFAGGGIGGGLGAGGGGLVQTSILRYSTRACCDVCGQHATSSLCSACRGADSSSGPGAGEGVPARSYLSLVTRLNALRTADAHLQRVCQQCVGGVFAAGAVQAAELFQTHHGHGHGQGGGGGADAVLLGSDSCESLDCPVFHRRYAALLRLEDLEHAMEALTT